MTPLFEIGEHVWALDGFDTRQGMTRDWPSTEKRLKIITGPAVAGLYPCRTIEGWLSLGFRGDQLRKATDDEIKNYRPMTGKEVQR